MEKCKNKFLNIRNLYIRFISLLIANVFIFCNIQSITCAKNLKPNRVYNSGILGFGGIWDFKSNDDGKNTITLVKCRKNKKTELKSPISSHDVTRVANEFSLVRGGNAEYSTLDIIKSYLAIGLSIPPTLIMVCLMNKNEKYKAKIEKFLEYLDQHFPNLGSYVNMFEGNRVYSDITSIDLSKCISVGHSAFKGNKNLVNVNLPECTTIGESAFLYDKNLTNINASKNYKIVHKKTFRGCEKLIDIPNEELLENIYDSAFSFSGIKKANLKSCLSVTRYSFSHCKDLTSISIPLCTHIGGCCFYCCEKLSKVNLPKCVYLGYDAFNNCSSLSELNLPNVQEIKPATFAGCSNLTSIYLPECKKISDKAFCCCDNSEKEKIESCKSLKKIVVPKDCIIEDGTLPESKMECIERI